MEDEDRDMKYVPPETEDISVLEQAEGEEQLPDTSSDSPETQETSYDDGEVPEEPSRAERLGEIVGKTGGIVVSAGERGLGYIGDRMTKPVPEDDFSDLTGVSRDDITGDAYGEDNDDLFDVSEEDVMGDDGDSEMDDILGVDDEDIMGPAPKPRPSRTRRVVHSPRRPTRRYQPDSSLGGMNY